MDPDEIIEPQPEAETPFYKVFLLGDAGVGKSSLLLRYTDNTYKHGFKRTLAEDFKVKTTTVNERQVRLKINDTAGQERVRNRDAKFYRGDALILVMFDVTDQKSFDGVRSWLNEADRYAGTEGVKVLVGTKTDLGDERVVTYDRAKEFAESQDMPYVETSAKDALGVKEAFELGVAKVLENTKLKPQITPKPIIIKEAEEPAKPAKEKIKKPEPELSDLAKKRIEIVNEYIEKLEGDPLQANAFNAKPLSAQNVLDQFNKFVKRIETAKTYLSDPPAPIFEAMTLEDAQNIIKQEEAACEAEKKAKAGVKVKEMPEHPETEAHKLAEERMEAEAVLLDAPALVSIYDREDHSSKGGQVWPNKERTLEPVSETFNYLVRITQSKMIEKIADARACNTTAGGYEDGVTFKEKYEPQLITQDMKTFFETRTKKSQALTSIFGYQSKQHSLFNELNTTRLPTEQELNQKTEKSDFQSFDRFKADKKINKAIKEKASEEYKTRVAHLKAHIQKDPTPPQPRTPKFKG